MLLVTLTLTLTRTRTRTQTRTRTRTLTLTLTRNEAAAFTAKLNKERDAMAHVPPADRHKCKMVAEQLHAKLLKLYPQNPAWYKLFSQMVRVRLRLRP